MRRRFSAFVREAWQYVPSVDPLVWGWHVDAICAHLEEVAYGRIAKLLTNIPPGHAKSVLQSVLWPAWIWTWWPQCQFLMASYSAKFAVRDSVRCRAVIESDWYAQTFMGPGGWRLREDQNVKDYFINTVGGERIALGVGGVGRRAHVVGIDDPIDAVEVHSKAARDSVNDWLGQTISQRFVDARRPRISVVMQRLHGEDPAAFLLKGGGWEHLMLPSEFDPKRACVTHHTVQRVNGHVENVREEFFRDPRSHVGELLFPERFPREVLEEFKQPNQLGAQGYATQHGQLPAPPGGGFFKRAAWRFWKPDGNAPDYTGQRPEGCFQGPARSLPDEFDRVILSLDANFKETESGSFVAIHVWGLLGADRFLLQREHGRWSFTDTKQRLRQVCEGQWGIIAREKFVEEKANGSAIISELQNVIPGFIPVEPAGGKEARAAAAQPYQHSGNCYLPDAAPWLDFWCAEFDMFPRAPAELGNDDVDAFSQGMLAFEKPRTTMDAWGNASI